jgi:hypothetical protein
LESRISASFTKLSADITEKSSTFSTNFGRNQSNFTENQLLERKNHENNSITSTKFVHAAVGIQPATAPTPGAMRALFSAMGYQPR